MMSIWKSGAKTARRRTAAGARTRDSQGTRRPLPFDLGVVLGLGCFLLGSAGWASGRALAAPGSVQSVSEKTSPGAVSEKTSPGGAAATPAARLVLEIIDISQLHADVIGHAKEEVEILLGGVEIDVTWAGEESARDGDPMIGHRLRIVVTPAEPARWGLPSEAMGVTPTGVSPSRTVYIFRRPIERTLIDLRFRRLIGQAIGRVIVHEIAHAFGCEHEETGIMAPSLAGDVLKATGVSVTESVGDALRSALQAVATGAPAGSSGSDDAAAPKGSSRRDH